MYKCDVCGANCDCGELVGGVCLECLEEQKQEQLVSTKFARIINGPFYQIKLEDLLSG